MRGLFFALGAAIGFVGAFVTVNPSRAKQALRLARQATIEVAEILTSDGVYPQ